MGYVGVKPSAVPLTSADIADSIITSAKIVDGTIATADLNTGLTVNLGAGAVGTPTLTTSGDTNTGIFFPAADTIAFSEGGAESLRIDSSGDVGIGTTDPITKLHINTSSSGSNVNLLCLGNPNSADNTATSIVFAPTANDVTTRHARIQGTQKTNNSIELNFFTCQGDTPASRMRIIDDGSLILVGSTAQKASGTTWSNPSDTRLKDNKQNYTKGLNELLQINVKTWEWNGKAGTTQGTTGVGIVADEIESILPNTIDTYKAKLNIDDTEETDVKRFDATEITWLLLNSIKEQQAIITTLQTRLTALENI
jgi:hypothetical protein